MEVINNNVMLMQSEGIIMEFFLNDKKIEGQNLKEKVDNYCQLYDVPPSVKKTMHDIRLNRNIAAHALDMPVKKVDYTSKELRNYQLFYYQKKHKKPKNRDYLINSQGSSVTITRGKTVIQECKFGYECRRGDCQFIHPQGRSIDNSDQSNEVTIQLSDLSVTSKKVCKFGTACTRNDCTFFHEKPAEVILPVVTSKVPCKFGTACTKSDCTFFHEKPAEETSKVPCKFGTACTKSDCTFFHEKPAEETSKVPCKFGTACTKSDCTFFHEKQAEVIKVPCKFGTACTKIDCTFFHPERKVACKYGVTCTKKGCPYYHPTY